MSLYCSLEFEGGRGHDLDVIQIKPKSRHIRIDRCSLRDFSVGLIDITRESTYITVSRCHFSTHDKSMLIGADCNEFNDRCIQVTVRHCFFDGTRQWHPRVRFGKVHLYNNHTRNWGIYAVCASVESQIVSQCNICEAGHKVVIKYLTEKAADGEEGTCGWIRSEGDLLLNGAQSCLLDRRCQCGMCLQGPWALPNMDNGNCITCSQRGPPAVCTGLQAVPRPTDDLSTVKGTAAI